MPVVPMASTSKDSAILQRNGSVSGIDALLIMGVSGCGKSSVSRALCLRDDAFAIEGDAFHPPANIARMRAGIPLTDADRAGWLDTLADQLQQATAAGLKPVLTCSALKRNYRDRLRLAVPALGVVFLELSREAAAERVTHRPGHFMPASLIDSQFATLEPPLDEPLTLRLDATCPVDELAEAADLWWRRHSR